MTRMDAGATQEEGGELPIHPKGNAQLTITHTDHKFAQSGRPMLFVVLEIEPVDGQEFEPIFHNILFASDEEKAADAGNSEDTKLVANRKRWARDIRRFCAVFGVPIAEDGTFDDDDLMGAQGVCLLDTDEYEGVDKNVLKLPKVV